jgi:glucose/arabinose dehydrogenase
MIAFKKYLLPACVALSAVFATACTTGLGKLNNSGADRVKNSQESQESNVDVQELVSGLNHPWGMAFLPDGRLLLGKGGTPAANG